MVKVSLLEDSSSAWMVGESLMLVDDDMIIKEGAITCG